MKTIAPYLVALLTVVLLLVLAPEPANAQRLRLNRIKLGTIAPKNSIFHDALLKLRQQWKQISGGTIDLVIYPGGVTGDEVTMLRKMRAGQLQAALISGSGMSALDEGVSALQVPLMFNSLEEFDYVRDKLAPVLEQRLDAKGVKVLGWGDAGWAYFFGTKDFRTPDDVRKMKLYTSKGDAEMLRLYNQLGFHAVPLDLTELQANLETRLVEVFTVPPLLAAGYQWFASAPNMLNLRFAPIVGALLINQRVWEQIAAEWQVQLMESAQAAAAEIQRQVRINEEDAISAMQGFGLKVIEVDQDLLTVWKREAERVYPELRDSYAPSELMDEVVRYRELYRNR